MLRRQRQEDPWSFLAGQPSLVTELREKERICLLRLIIDLHTQLHTCSCAYTHMYAHMNAYTHTHMKNVIINIAGYHSVEPVFQSHELSQDLEKAQGTSILRLGLKRI